MSVVTLDPRKVCLRCLNRLLAEGTPYEEALESLTVGPFTEDGWTTYWAARKEGFGIEEARRQARLVDDREPA